MSFAGGRGRKIIAGTTYRYFRTYRDRKAASDRRDRIEEHGRKVILEEREIYPLFTIWVEMTWEDRILLGLLDFIQEFLQPGWSVPYEKSIKTDEMVLR
jgi:hypothetical protein